VTDDEFWSATIQLALIHQWARARYTAPWAVLGAVLLRVLASAGEHVQLPGVIGGRASLNLGVVFVGPSGAGKGNSDKVGRQAWPTPVIERPLGSGEGIAALFQTPKKEGSERITRAIFTVPEVDTLTGIAARQGSILLAQLKSALMGELIGQSNASEETSRVVQAHSYRCCLSIGAQPGHASVIFNDTSGGTPQRLLWLPTTDPTMPAERTPDPEPLNHRLPGLLTRVHDDPSIVTEMVYGTETIAGTILTAHLARQRGEGDALDGHALLTRCKVAAALAILDHRTVVSADDWELSAVIMAKSDQTRAGMIESAKQAARAKVRERAMSRAYGENVVADSKVERAAKGILAKLRAATAPMSAGEIRRSLRSDLRPEFAPALDLLTTQGHVHILDSGLVVHVDRLSTPENSSSEHMDGGVPVDSKTVVTAIENCRTDENTAQPLPPDEPELEPVKPPRFTRCEVCYVGLPASATEPFCDLHERGNTAPPQPPIIERAVNSAARARPLHVVHDGTSFDSGTNFRRPGSHQSSKHNEETPA
jgi:hypothetical protein